MSPSLIFGRRQKRPGQAGICLPISGVYRLCRPAMDSFPHHTRGVRQYFQRRSRPCGLYGVGHAHLHGGYLLHRHTDLLPADLYGPGAGQNKPAHGMPSKTGASHPPDLYPAPYSPQPGVWRLCGGTGQRYPGSVRNWLYAVLTSQPNPGWRSQNLKTLWTNFPDGIIIRIILKTVVTT